MLQAALSAVIVCAVGVLTAMHLGPGYGLVAGILVGCVVAMIPVHGRDEELSREPASSVGADSSAAVLNEFIRMISRAVDERTTYLRGHSERVSRYSALMARELRLAPEQVERIRLSAMLHDIGTLGIDDSVINKGRPLTAEEFEIVKAHTVKGAAILRPIAALNDLIPGVELHHESLDGSGYPYGLHRDEIPTMARIIAVADSFDAMTTPRPYQPAMEPDYVLEVLGRLGGIRYDESAVAALTMLVMNGKLVIEHRKFLSEKTSV